MIDEIFADIMQEARARPGKDMVKKIYTVSTEIAQRLFAAIEGIKEAERRAKENEI